MVRNGKTKSFKKALESLPNIVFDTKTISAQFSPGVGTLYDESTERLGFHINMKNAKNGNTLILLACQNDHQKIAECLVKKGANVNHQNVRLELQLM